MLFLAHQAFNLVTILTGQALAYLQASESAAVFLRCQMHLLLSSRLLLYMPRGSNYISLLLASQHLPQQCLNPVTSCSSDEQFGSRPRAESHFTSTIFSRQRLCSTVEKKLFRMPASFQEYIPSTIFENMHLQSFSVSILYLSFNTVNTTPLPS